MPDSTRGTYARLLFDLLELLGVKTRAQNDLSPDDANAGSPPKIEDAVAAPEPDHDLFSHG